MPDSNNSHGCKPVTNNRVRYRLKKQQHDSKNQPGYSKISRKKINAPNYPWPEIFRPLHMENTLTIYVESLNEQWELPDILALKWNEYEKENPLEGDNSNADELHQQWFNTLSPEEQAEVKRSTPEG